MVQGFNIKEQALGDGINNTFTFDFKIFKATSLLIYIQDAAGNILQKFRGDNTDYLSSAVFDSIKGGGSITLVTTPLEDYVITMFSASDAPDQPTSFGNKTSFSLPAIEGALDFLASCIQRVSFLAKRSMRMHDLDDTDNFDPTLPPNIANYPGGIIAVKLDRSGFEVLTWNGSTWAPPT